MTTRARNTNAPKLSPADKKRRFVELFGEGVSVDEAARILGCSPKTHEYYMGSDSDYRDRVLAIRATQGRRDIDMVKAALESDISFRPFVGRRGKGGAL